MKSYRIKFRNCAAWLRLDYADDDGLQMVTLIDGHEMDERQKNYVWGFLIAPFKTSKEMLDYVESAAKQDAIRNEKPKFTVDLLPADTSFEAFWNAYGNKVGKKERTQQLWKLMSEDKRLLAMAGIKKYKNWLILNTAVQMLYPETYLSQKRWENEF